MASCASTPAPPPLSAAAASASASAAPASHDANAAGEEAMTPAAPNPAPPPGTTNNRFHLADAVAEWRSREQLEPSAPSTSPGFWESDDDDASALSISRGPKPADLYGKFTWKIENFSEISKRELRSNVFEVGGYKWYILVYPQGCDVCNHLSLFLCVADYDKLLPGWSHFAQFTIAVVNKDPKKSKYSDTLHRFCKKEHDWGWKKFMELSKVMEGFAVEDTLVIKAQVQVIRENPNRPFRCLDCQYRRELVRVYLTNVEGICRRFVEEKREKLGKVIEDTLRWSSFRAFWSAVEENARRRLAREKTDVIFKAVVKRFFNEKEVTSTLVMDALYSGCKALEYQRRSKKHKGDGGEEVFTPVVWMEKEYFVLAGDILALLERAVLEPLPSYKDDKGPQNRTKDGLSGDEFGKEFVERDERRLTELGRRTVEMFVLAYLFSNRIEVAYREAVALKRQEELIREEEAAGQAESELKAKREAAEREKRSKKKQAKQRRKDRKGKDKEAAEKRIDPEPLQDNSSSSRQQILLVNPGLTSLLLAETEEGLDGVVGTLGKSEDPSWERDASFVPQEMEASFSGSLADEAGVQSKRVAAALDDSSSTCSSDSLPSVRPTSSNGARVAAAEQNHTFYRGRNRAAVDGFDSDGRLIEGDAVLRTVIVDTTRSTGETSSSCSPGGVDSEAVILSLKERVRWLEKRLQEKEEEVVLLHEQLSFVQHRAAGDQTRSSHKVADSRSGSEAGSNNPRGEGHSDGDGLHKGRSTKVDNRQFKSGKTPASNGGSHHHPSWPAADHIKGASRSSEPGEPARPGMTASAMPVFSRAATGQMNGPRPSIPYPLQSIPPALARSMSASGRLNSGVEPGDGSVSKQGLPVSYRNAAVGRLHSPGVEMSNGAFVRPPAPAPAPGPALAAGAPLATSAPATPKLAAVPEQQAVRVEESVDSKDVSGGGGRLPKHTTSSSSSNQGDDSLSITFGTITHEVLHTEHQAVEEGSRGEETNNSSDSSAPSTTKHSPSVAAASAATETVTATAAISFNSAGSSAFLLSDEFPHLDIINDLLDEDKSLGRTLDAILHPAGGREYHRPQNPVGEGGGAGSKQQQQHHQQQQQRRIVIPGSEGPQMMSSYGHAAAAAAMGLQSERYWPMSRGLSMNGVSFNESPGRYNPPLHHHHHLVPERVTLSHDGYSVYAPLQ